MAENNYITTIPYYESSVGKRDILKKCLASLPSPILVLAGKQKTLPTAWNMCIELGFSTGAEYVIVANDDIELIRGDLSMLCKPNGIVNPLVNGSFFKIFHAHIFGIHKDAWEKIGEFDENFQVYWSDTDYAMRMINSGVDIYMQYGVDVLHPNPASTIGSTPDEIRNADKEYFISKWGREYIDPLAEKDVVVKVINK